MRLVIDENGLVQLIDATVKELKSIRVEKSRKHLSSVGLVFDCDEFSMMQFLNREQLEKGGLLERPIKPVEWVYPDDLEQIHWKLMDLARRSTILADQWSKPTIGRFPRLWAYIGAALIGLLLGAALVFLLRFLFGL